MQMFDEMADKIMEEAGVPKEGNEDWHKQISNILSTQMAMLSASMGLSMDRVDRFEEQKRALVEDLKERKAAGLTT